MATGPPRPAHTSFRVNRRGVLRAGLLGFGGLQPWPDCCDSALCLGRPFLQKLYRIPSKKTSAIFLFLHGGPESTRNIRPQAARFETCPRSALAHSQQRTSPASMCASCCRCTQNCSHLVHLDPLVYSRRRWSLRGSRAFHGGDIRDSNLGHPNSDASANGGHHRPSASASRVPAACLSAVGMGLVYVTIRRSGEYIPGFGEGYCKYRPGRPPIVTNRGLPNSTLYLVDGRRFDDRVSCRDNSIASDTKWIKRSFMDSLESNSNRTAGPYPGRPTKCVGPLTSHKKIPKLVARYGDRLGTKCPGGRGGWSRPA